jgi:hypothetical protein
VCGLGLLSAAPLLGPEGVGVVAAVALPRGIGCIEFAGVSAVPVLPWGVAIRGVRVRSGVVIPWCVGSWVVRGLL